jgi:outer membrane immunogenic protein
MKMKLLIALAFLALSVLPAAAAQGPYVGGSVGLFIPHESDLKIAGGGSANVEYDIGFGLDIKAGYNFDGYRLEGEFGYKVADVDKVSASGITANLNNSDITILSYMVNGYYDFKVRSPLKPFIGAGIGIINGKLNDSGSKTDDTVFGYQITAGVSYPVNRNLNFELYYRFQGSSDIEDAGDKLSYTSSNLNAGLRYNF